MNLQQQQCKSYTYLRKTAMECRDVLLKSETQARDKIAEMRYNVQRRVFERLREAERKTLCDLREIVMDQETRIAQREKQVEEMLETGDQLAFDDGVLEFEFKEVRYHAEDMFDETFQTSLSLGSISLENITIAQMAEYGCKPSILYTQDNDYNEIPSMNNFERYQYTSSAGASDGSSEETHEYDICSDYPNIPETNGTISAVYVNEDKEDKIYEFESISNTTYDDVAINLTHFPDTVEQLGSHNHTVDLNSKIRVYHVRKKDSDRTCDDGEYLTQASSAIKIHEHENVDRGKHIPDSTTMKQFACEIVNSESGTLSFLSPTYKDAQKHVAVVDSAPSVTRHPTCVWANVEEQINMKIQSTTFEKSTHYNVEISENAPPIYSTMIQRRQKSPTSVDLFSDDSILPIIDKDATGRRPTTRVGIDEPINVKMQTNSIEENRYMYGNVKISENAPPIYSTMIQRRPKSPTSMDLFIGDSIGHEFVMDETGRNPTTRVGIGSTDTEVCKEKNTHNVISSTRITNWKTFHYKRQYNISITLEESCRFTVLPDERLVVLFESEETLTLFDKHNKHVKTLKINCPKAICNGKDDRVAVVQRDDHNEHVILIEAKSSYLHIYDCKKINFEDRTVDIKYRHCRYYLGCCNFKVYVCDEELNSMLLVYCGDSSYLMVSSDYNHVTNTYYTVNSAGSVKNVKDDKYDTYHVQGIAVCCHDDKAYVLCDQGRKVVELYEHEGPRQRDVIHFKGTTPVDMCISSNGAALFVLFSDTKELAIEIYEIQNNSLTNTEEKNDTGHQRE